MKEFIIALIYITPFIFAPIVFTIYPNFLYDYAFEYVCGASIDNCIFQQENKSNTILKLPLYSSIINVVLFALTFGTAKMKANNIGEKYIKYFFVSILYVSAILSTLITYFLFLTLIEL